MNWNFLHQIRWVTLSTYYIRTTGLPGGQLKLKYLIELNASYLVLFTFGLSHRPVTVVYQLSCVRVFHVELYYVYLFLWSFWSWLRGFVRQYKSLGFIKRLFQGHRDLLNTIKIVSNGLLSGQCSRVSAEVFLLWSNSCWMSTHHC